MQNTTGCVETMGYIKTPYKHKQTVVRGKLLPMGLYGCEVAPANEAVLTRFRAAIASVVAFTTKRRSVDLTFAVAADKGDLDPVMLIYAGEGLLR